MNPNQLMAVPNNTAPLEVDVSRPVGAGRGQFQSSDQPAALSANLESLCDVGPVETRRFRILRAFGG